MRFPTRNLPPRSVQTIVATIESVIRFELIAILGVLAAIIFYRLITGAIHTTGLLRASDGTPSANDVQMLALTVAAAGYYLVEATRSAPEGHLPAVPVALLMVVAASHAGFHGLPFVRFLLGNRKDRA
jgi:hypothetical protein